MQNARFWLLAAQFLVTTPAALASTPDCVPQTQVDVAKIDRQIVLVGEAHGTNEIPRFTLGLVCSLLRAGRPVVLGVEHSGEQQDTLNRFLKSAGTPDDRADLMKGLNWSRYSDGRGSVAMFELVDALRRLRGQGERVGILAIDRNENLDVPLRDDEKVHVPPAANALLNRIGNEAMADNVLYAATLNANYTVVVLSGYSHTSTIVSRSDEPMIMTYQPMGQIINERSPTFTIGIEVGGGEHAWGGRTYAVEEGPLVVSGVPVDARVRIDRLTPSFVARDVVLRWARTSMPIVDKSTIRPRPAPRPSTSSSAPSSPPARGRA